MNINIIYVCCLSRMMRKYHVRFLEGKAPAMGLTYSTVQEIQTRARRQPLGLVPVSS